MVCVTTDGVGISQCFIKSWPKKIIYESYDQQLLDLDLSKVYFPKVHISKVYFSRVYFSKFVFFQSVFSRLYFFQVYFSEFNFPLPYPNPTQSRKALPYPSQPAHGIFSISNAMMNMIDKNHIADFCESESALVPCNVWLRVEVRGVL